MVGDYFVKVDGVNYRKGILRLTKMIDKGDDTGLLIGNERYVAFITSDDTIKDNDIFYHAVTCGFYRNKELTDINKSVHAHKVMLMHYEIPLRIKEYIKLGIFKDGFPVLYESKMNSHNLSMSDTGRATHTYSFSVVKHNGFGNIKI